MREVTRVGITSIGGVTAAVFIKSLRLVKHEKFYIVGMDANPLAFGFKFVDKGYVIPPATDEKKYLITLLNVCKREGIEVLVPLMDEELLTISKNVDMFKRKGIKVVTSSKATITTCLDKLSTYEKLGDKMFTKTYVANSIPATECNFPLVLKPRSGRGTQDVYVCNDELDLRALTRRVKNPVVQEYLFEPEYTVDLLSDLDGKPLIAIPRRRLRVKAGVTWQGNIEPRKDIEELCKLAAEKLGIIGPSCIQVRFTKRKKPKIFEVNPRVGGATILSVYGGINIPYFTVKLFLKRHIDLSKCRISKIFISRFFDEVFFTGNELNKIYEVA